MQHVTRHVVAQRGGLHRVEHDETGAAVRLYPFTRKRDLHEPKVVVIDPHISYGRPVLAGTGIPTAVLAERYKAGESMDELADEPELDSQEDAPESPLAGQRDDETIREDILRELKEDALTTDLDLDVEVIKGVAILNGSVPSIEDALSAEEIEDVARIAPRLLHDFEVVGGVEPAGTWVRRALTQGVSVVTANKMLLAAHAPELLHLAATNGAQLRFEAAVAGGVPLIHGVREGLAGDRLLRVAGILNGTSNYILSRMAGSDEAMSVVLADAQRLGYAEADPSADVDGHDAAARDGPRLARQIAEISGKQHGGSQPRSSEHERRHDHEKLRNWGPEELRNSFLSSSSPQFLSFYWIAAVMPPAPRIALIARMW